MTVETIKAVANAAKEAMTMRQFFTTPRVEQGWASVLSGLFETSRGAVVVARLDLVVGFGNLLDTRGIKIPAGLVETLVVETLVVGMGESVVNEMFGGSAVELDPVVEMGIFVTETG